MFRKVELVPGQEHSIQISAAQIDSDQGIYYILKWQMSHCVC